MNFDDQNEKLARALQDAEQRRRIFVPPTLDEAILKLAREQFGARKEQRPRPSFRWLWIFSSSVAVMALCFVLLRSPRQFARQDINRDGEVNILDAMTLAKQGGEAADIEAIALASVRLN